MFDFMDEIAYYLTKETIQIILVEGNGIKFYRNDKTNYLVPHASMHILFEKLASSTDSVKALNFLFHKCGVPTDGTLTVKEQIGYYQLFIKKSA